MTNRREFVRFAFLASVEATHLLSQEDAPAVRDVLVGDSLKSPFNMGVDDNEHRHNWLSKDDGHLVLSYPPGLDWGAVFITRGQPKVKPRPFIDLSAYKTLVIDMRGGLGGEHIEIGIKTNEQDDDGSETKLPVKLTANWKEYPFPLRSFKDASPDKLYVVTEFVFADSKAQTVLVRGVKYTK